MNPSLLLIPDRYKAAKLYSQIPDTGAGDLDFTRVGDTATRVNSAGLIEKVRTNLLTYSQDFSDASYLVGTGQTKTLGQIDPFGGNTAVLISNVSEANGFLSKALTLAANVSNTFSIYIKGSTSGSVSIRIDDSTAGPQFDVNYTTSWQRFSVTRIVNQASCFFTVGGYSTWAIGENIQFAFAQAETGDIATPYIPTTTAAVSVGPVANIPRIDYTGGGCGKLLLEPQRTNLLLRSEEFNNAYWTKDGLTTVVANATTAPNGLVIADKLVDSSLTGSITFGFATSAQPYVLSIFAKASERNSIRVGSSFGAATFNLIDGTISNTTGSVVPSVVAFFSNGWVRVSIAFTSVAATPNFSFSNDGAGSIVSGSSGIFIWGAQIEAGSYPTSYIPTTSATVTRGADEASKTGISSLIGQTEGTLFVEMNNLNELDIPEITIDDNTNDNRIVLTRTAPDGFWAIFTASAGVGNVTAGTTTGNSGKFALAYSSAGYVLYRNGIQVATRTAALPVSLSAIRLNGRSTSDFFGNKNILTAALYTTRLSNAELQTLTTL